jgi:hypothetical protein
MRQIPREERRRTAAIVTAVHPMIFGGNPLA